MRKKATSAASTSDEVSSIKVEPLKMREVSLCILGASPFIFNRQSTKAQRTLLLPAITNRASQRATLKHDPLKEYRDSVYTTSNNDAPTRLMFPSPAFKGAASTAALHVPGDVTKTAVGRLLQVTGYQVHIYGVPQLFMCGVRQSGMNRTPDIRTRAILPEWATYVTVRYPIGCVDPASVANLFAAGGQICGVGDFRQEKGKGSFGLYSLVNEDNEDFARIVSTMGREAQDAALDNPEAFNAESASLWQWFEEEVTARGRGSEATRVESEVADA